MIKNILFDFGAVILNINFKLTQREFQNLGISKFEEVLSKFKQDSFMQDFERGKHAPSEFYNYVRTISNSSLTNNQIAHAWNALLLDYPEKRINLLKELCNTYSLYLLSNTNEVHYNAFKESFNRKFSFDLDSLFTSAYYSHIIQERKPDASSFNYVLQDAQIKPEETLFIDDTKLNTNAAKTLGFQVIHLEDGMELCEVLPAFLAKFN